MTKRTIWIAGLLILIGGVIYLINQQKYTTFDEVFSEQLNENSIVRSVTIRIGEDTDNYAYMEIEDEEVIDQIVESFSGLELKEDNNARGEEADYIVRITTTKRIEEGLSKTDSISIMLHGDYLNRYQVVWRHGSFEYDRTTGGE